jgi:hypothetical protein
MKGFFAWLLTALETLWRRAVEVARSFVSVLKQISADYFGPADPQVVNPTIMPAKRASNATGGTA